MPTDVHELEFINGGLVLDGRKSAMEYSPEDFVTKDWQAAIKILQRKGAKKEDLAKVLSSRIMNDAHEAVCRMNGLGENFDWRGELIRAKRKYDVGRRMGKVAEELERNEDVDLLSLHGDLTALVAGESTGLSLAKDIDYSTYKPFQLSGYKPIDDIVGGYPSDGPIVVFGAQKTGKSFFGANAMSCFLATHKQKTGAIYSFEMGVEHYMYRSAKMYPQLKNVLDRLYVSGMAKGVEELVAEVTTKRLDFVVIDDMDRIVKSVDPASYQIAYFRLAEICRFLKIPVMILAQPNRTSKMSKKFLDSYSVSWSSGGENSAAMLIGLQRANSIDLEDDSYPLTDSDRLFLIFLLSRDGWPKQEGPGAIRLDNANPNQLWSGTPYLNRLWTYGSGRKNGKIGKKNE